MIALVALWTAACSEPTVHKSPLLAQEAPASESDSQPERHPASDAELLTVATFNINFGNVDLPSIANTIAETDADLVFLQETNQESARFLKEHLGTTYSHASFSDSDANWAAGGFGFLSKLPIQEPRFIPAGHGLFGSFVTDLSVGGRVLRLINLHLSPIRVGGATGIRSMLDALRQMEEVHKKEASLFASLLVADRPTIIAGDFNSTSSQVAPSVLAQLGFHDAVDLTLDNADTQRTWRWPVGGQDIGFRIDYVFHSKEFSATSSKIIHSEASDHHLVMAHLRWI